MALSPAAGAADTIAVVSRSWRRRIRCGDGSGAAELLVGQAGPNVGSMAAALMRLRRYDGIAIVEPQLRL